MRTVTSILLCGVFVLAGCLGAGTADEAGRARGSDADVAAPSGDFSHLEASGAETIDAGETRTFSWSGEVGSGGSVPLLGTAPGSPSVTFSFPIDNAVGFLEANLTREPSATNLILYIRDGEGRIACGVRSSAGACYAPVPHNATLSDYSAEVESQSQEATNPFRLDVTLHPPHHLKLGQVTGPLDDRFVFHLADTGFDTGEPSIGITSDGTIFDQVGLATVRSRDWGLTWQDVRPPLTTTTLDPMLTVDPWTDRVIANHLYVACSYASYSDDQGETWITHPAVCGMPADDHQKMTIGGHPVPGNPVFDGTIYYSFNSFALLVDNAAHIVVSRSYDGGLNYIANVAAQERLDFGYRTGGPIVADRDGNVYVGMFVTGGRFGVAASNDFGNTWNAVIAGTDSAGNEGIDPGVAFDAAGNVYGAYEGPSGVQVVISRDHGATWQGQRVVSPEGLKSFVHTDVVAGDEGRVAVAYLATADSDRGPNRAHGWSRWHLWLSMTENALDPEPVWVSTRLTPEDDPVQIGTICTGGTGCFGGNRNLLDFIDIAVGPDGRVAIAYTDGCEPDECWELPQESRENAGIVAVQYDGPRLFATRAPWAA